MQNSARVSKLWRAKVSLRDIFHLNYEQLSLKIGKKKYKIS